MDEGTLDERFELESLVGHGGMGAVYRARDRLTGERVAVKLLRGAEARHLRRFEREGQALSQLAHPGIVRYVAQGSCQGHAYLAMEWLDGETLEDRLAKSALSVAEALDLGMRVASALAEAHRKGIVHRDLKPANLLLVGGKAEEAKILDFGIARLGSERARLTRTGAPIGSALYMSPEQARASPSLDERTDIYSLGAVLHEALTLQPPFEGDDVAAILANILVADPEPLRIARPDAPAALETLLAAMLAKAPDKRPASAAAVASELGSIRETLDAGGGYAKAPGSVPRMRQAHRATAEVMEQRVVSVVLVRSRQETAPATVDIDWGATLVIDIGDPAETHFARRELVAEVAANGGKLEVLADGSMLVILSGDTTKEKATHAARCALALQRRLGEAAIAICTGQAVVRRLSAVGEVTELAARLLAGDPPAGIRIDHATATLLEARFSLEVDELGTWLRGERLTPEPQALLGKAIPCVGRERDLDVLRAHFRECVEESVARAVLVTAPPGQGKSRVSHELLNRLRGSGEAFRLLAGSADSLRAGSSFATVGPMLRALAGVSPADPLEAQRASVRTLGRRLGAEADRVCAFLGELMGVPFDDAGLPALAAARGEPRLMADQMLAAWLDWLEAECAAGPVLIVVDDLQWADPPSVQLLGGALRTMRDRPLMVLGLARPEVEERFPDLWSEYDATTVRLGGLSRKAADRLLDEALGELIDAEGRARLVDRADGNPFYLEELARAVATGGIGQDLPVTVLGMVHARLDALGDEARHVLCAASLFGGEFQPAGVRAVLGDGTSEADVERWLGILAEREIIHEKRGATQRTYRFHHALLREGAYALLADPDRAVCHKLAGDYLEHAGETRAAVIAEHFDRGQAPERAVGWYRKAATQAAEAGDLVAVIAYAERCKACGVDGEAAGELAFLQADAHCWRREYDEATIAADSVLELLDAGSPTWLRACAVHVMASVDRGQWDSAERFGRKMLAAARGPHVEPSAAVALAIAAHAFCVTAPDGPSQGLDTADVLMAAAQDASSRSAVLDPLSRAFAALARAARFYAVGRFDVSLSYNLDAAKGFRSAGDLRNAAVAIANAGSDLVELGAYARATATLAEAAEIAHRMGIIVFDYRGELALLRGELAEAERLLRLQLEQAEKQGQLRISPFIRGRLAHALLEQGRYEESVALCRDAAVSPSSAEPPNSFSTGALCLALLALDRPEEAQAATSDMCAAVLSSPRRVEGDVYLLLAAVQALEANGQREAAREVLSVARSRVEARASAIEDRSFRESFLAIPDNARTLALAREWGLSGEAE